MSKPLFGVTNKSLSSKYSHKVATPQYLPSDRKPDLGELVDYTKYAKLVKEIRDSNVSDDEKKFLVTAASGCPSWRTRRASPVTGFTPSASGAGAPSIWWIPAALSRTQTVRSWRLCGSRHRSPLKLQR